MMLLAGDIGGTKSELAVVASHSGPRRPIAQATYASGNYPDLATLVRDFLASNDVSVRIATFGVAGPVIDGHAEGTNLPWTIDEGQLQSDLSLESVHLLNDLQAIAHAVPILDREDLFTLNEGKRIAKGPMAIVAPGTGLGEGFLTWSGAHWTAHPSEGGHADFAPNTPLEIDLLRWLQERHGHVSYERVCSGRGLPNLYSFLKPSRGSSGPPWLAEEIAKAEDPTPIIVGAALDEDSPCPLCREVLDLFVSILGAEAGNLALKVMATGGVYLAGGIPPRILPALIDGRFLGAFQHKGRLSYVVRQMPVYVVLNGKTGLLGAAHYGLENQETSI